MKLGVIGGGVVGRATARCFLEHVDEVRVHDIVKERSTHGLFDVCECDLIFVCLPTPRRKDELAADVRPIVSLFLDMPAEYRGRNFVIRSTVPIGTTRRLRKQHGLTSIVHSPEFLTARCAIADAQLPARNVIGQPGGLFGEAALGNASWSACYCALSNLYLARFPGVPVHVMTSDESEATKLMQNSFFAVKVAFWNECRALADRLGLDWGRVMAAILADGRIAHAHTKVPGPDGKFGFGGSCLPKDLANLIQCLVDADVEHDLTSAAYNRNRFIDRNKIA